MTASCAHEIPFDDREDARHDSLDASRIGMFPIAQHQSRMAEDALQKKWIAWDLMLRRERGIDRVERGFVRGAEFGGGDPTAMRLCIERLIPVRKGRPVVFDLPAIETAADVANALGAIAGAMAAGELTPDEAGAVAGVIEFRRRAIETVEHEERLRKLEDSQIRRNESW